MSMFTEDGMPVSPGDNNTRMSDVDLENISSDSGEIVSSLNMVSVFSTNRHSTTIKNISIYINIYNNRYYIVQYNAKNLNHGELAISHLSFERD